MSIHIRFISPDQSTQELRAKPGQSLMQAAVEAGIQGIAADCGGTLICATCHVMLAEPWASRLPAPEPDERDMLAFTSAPQQTGSRLSCQIQLTPELDGLEVQLPTSQH